MEGYGGDPYGMGGRNPFIAQGEALDVGAEAMAAEMAENAKYRSAQLKNQGKQLEIQGRTAEANAAYQQAQIELRKAELIQQKYLKERDQQLQASGMLAQLRGPGNWSQFLDLGRRLGSFGTQSTALAQIAAGGVATGSFAPGGSGKPQSLQERLSGNLGAPSEDAMAARDRNDRQLAAQISSRSGQLARGSLESLDPVERAYLGSAAEAEGYDWNSALASYKRAGLMQGARR